MRVALVALVLAAAIVSLAGMPSPAPAAETKCTTVAETVTAFREVSEFTGLSGEIDVRPIEGRRQVVITRLSGEPRVISVFEGGCLVRNYIGPLLPEVPRAEA